MKLSALLVMAVLALQTPAQPDLSATIEGSVTIYGTTEALPKVQVTIQSTEFRGYRADSVTDARGHFAFDSLPAGIYNVSALRGGYAAPVLNELHVPYGSQRTVAVAPQQRLANVDLELIRGGVITGRIVDANGRPIPQLRTVAQSVNSGFTISTTETDDKGEYRLFGLYPGKYIVSAEFRSRGASIEPQASWVKTFFPGVVTTARASTMDVGEGAVVTSADFVMQSSARFAISGNVTLPRSDLTGLGPLEIFLVPSDADAASRERLNPASIENLAPQRTSSGNMPFEIRAVPGSYELIVLVLDGRRNSALVGRSLVRVIQQDVKEIIVTTSGASVTGKVMVTGRGPGSVGSLDAWLSPVDGLPSIVSLGVSPAGIDPNGNFTISNVPDGKWRLVTQNLPSDLTIADIRQGSISLSRDGIRVADKSAEPIQLIFSPAGSIDGFVRDADQNPIAAIPVVAFPYNQAPAVDAHRAITDAFGHFVLTGLAPGEHALFAVPPILWNGIRPLSPVMDFQPAVTPYQLQATIAKVTSGSSTSITLAPLKPIIAPER